MNKLVAKTAQKYSYKEFVHSLSNDTVTSNSVCNCIQILHTVYGEFGLGLMPADRVLGPTYVHALVCGPSMLDLETAVLEDLKTASTQTIRHFTSHATQHQGLTSDVTGRSVP